MNTYTTHEAAQRLGNLTRTGLHYLRQTYPRFFVTVKVGGGRAEDNTGKQTLYDAAKIDELATLRDSLRGMKG